MRIILARPRGFCAGVERAIGSVLQAVQRFGPPVYVLNHIVHNNHVVQSLAEKGVIFVKDLAEVPAFSTLLFSAHGVAPNLWEQAKERCLSIIDATCPLVERVHREVTRYARGGRTVIYIGDERHDEAIGAMGHAPGQIVAVKTLEDVERLEIRNPDQVAYVTQTTLSLEDVSQIVTSLKQRFPAIVGPNAGDICYATTNRQAALRHLGDDVDLVLVVGDTASANSKRLAQIARAAGKIAYLIPEASAICQQWVEDVETILLTSGASVPDYLVQEVVAYFQKIATCIIEERIWMVENMRFSLPEPFSR